MCGRSSVYGRGSPLGYVRDTLSNRPRFCPLCTLPSTPPEETMPASVEDEWLWGWDPTPGIVSVWAERNGRAVVWRRAPDSGMLTREEDRFRPWLLLPALDDLSHLGARLLPEG